MRGDFADPALAPPFEGERPRDGGGLRAFSVEDSTSWPRDTLAGGSESLVLPPPRSPFSETDLFRDEDLPLSLARLLAPAPPSRGLSSLLFSFSLPRLLPRSPLSPSLSSRSARSLPRPSLSFFSRSARPFGAFVCASAEGDVDEDMAAAERFRSLFEDEEEASPPEGGGGSGGDVVPSLGSCDLNPSEDFFSVDVGGDDDPFAAALEEAALDVAFGASLAESFRFVGGRGFLPGLGDDAPEDLPPPEAAAPPVFGAGFVPVDLSLAVVDFFSCGSWVISLARFSICPLKPSAMELMSVGGPSPSFLASSSSCAWIFW